MKKVWPFISTLLLGIIGGIAIGVKWLSGNAIEINVRKIKQKRISGHSEVTVPIEVKSGRERKERAKNRRKQRRVNRK